MLRLRPYKKSDAKHIISWIKDEKSFYQWSAGRFENYPITADDLNAQYDAFSEADEFFPMAAFDEDGVAGQLFMKFLDDEKKELRFGYIIVDASKRGRGYGKEMLLLALKYAFEILKVERVTLGVFENNPSAYKCYKSVGFREVPGENHSYMLMGEEWNCLELEIHV